VRKLATAGILIACIMLICRASAANHPHRYRLMLPCFPAVAWSALARKNKLEAIFTRVDSDGDTWIVWEVEGEVEGRDYWRLTFLPKDGLAICVVGGAGSLSLPPANKENI
jgi:hypothetical protein